MYNCRTYLVGDIVFNLNPKTYEFSWEHEDIDTKLKKKIKTNMIEYFKMKYDIQIHPSEESQPLLVSNNKNQMMFFPPSLCYEANLPKNFTKDSRKMRNIDGYKIKDPLERYERIGRIVEQIESENTLQQWNLKLFPNFA